MVERQKFTTEQLRFAIEHGDFEKTVIAAAPQVACILTQSWCPQWTFMRSWLNQLESDGAETADLQLRIFEIEYDRDPIFAEFRSFKEQVWNNWEVPYVRYYRDGGLVHESNFVSGMMFLDNLRA